MSSETMWYIKTVLSKARVVYLYKNIGIVIFHACSIRHSNLWWSFPWLFFRRGWSRCRVTLPNGSQSEDLKICGNRLWTYAKCTWIDGDPDPEVLFITRWWFQTCFFVHPYLEKWSKLTNIFQMGWNHQVDYHWCFTQSTWSTEQVGWSAEEDFRGRMWWGIVDVFGAYFMVGCLAV